MFHYLLLLEIVLGNEGAWSASGQCEITRNGRFGPESLRVGRIPELSSTVVRWEIIERLSVEIRDPKPDKEILCESMRYVLNNKKIRNLPFYLKWTRNDVLNRMKYTEPTAECPELHMSITQRKEALAIDCFFRNRGDIVVRFLGYEDRCLGSVDLDIIDSVCDSFMDFIDALLKSSIQRKIETHPANFIGNLAADYLLKMRRSIKGRTGELSSVTLKNPRGFENDSSDDEW